MKKKVLIIENDLEIKQLVSYILELEGYEVTKASHEPISELPTEVADLILLDEWLNKREGHMLCKEIKTVESLKYIPVIIFSTAPDIADIAKNCNADGFVHKPFELDTLINEVKRLLPLKASSTVT